MEGSVYFEDSPCPSIVAAVESPSSEPPAEAAPAEAVSEAPVSPDLSAENSAVAPGEAAPSPATSTPPNAGEEGDYPALREALRKIAAKDGKAGKAEKGSDQGNRPAWRKLLRIGSGAK